MPVVVVNPRQESWTGATSPKPPVCPSIRPLRTEEAQELGPLTTRRNQVMTMLVGEKNRLRQATRSIRPRVEAHVNWLARELKDLDKDFRQTLQQSPIWR